MKLYTVKIYYPEGTKEETIPASDFGLIASLYSIFNIKVEMIKEEELIGQLPLIKIKGLKDN